MVKLIEKVEDFDAIVEKSRVVVSDFYADWCAPCRAIAPLIEDLDKTLNDEGAESKGKVKFVKVNVDSAHDLTRKLNISAMPTFVIYFDGDIEKTIVGANYDSVKETINSLLTRISEAEQDAPTEVTDHTDSTEPAEAAA